jgi:hypothetical protein
MYDSVFFVNRFVVFAIIFFISLKAESQEWQGSAYAESVGGAMVCEAGFRSLEHNPAGLAFAPMCFGAGYINKCGLKELSQKTAVAAIPVLRGVFGTGLHYYGFDMWNIVNASLAYATKLSETFSAGVRTSYRGLHVDDMPSRINVFSADVGMLCRPNDALRLGTWVSNITNSHYSDIDSILYIRIKVGAMYEFNGGHSLRVDIEKNNSRNEIAFNAGVVCKLREKIAVSMGATTLPFAVSFGTEFVVGNAVMHFAVKRYQYLGFCPSASLYWCVGHDTGRCCNTKK